MNRHFIRRIYIGAPDQNPGSMPFILLFLKTQTLRHLEHIRSGKPPRNQGDNANLKE